MKFYIYTYIYIYYIYNIYIWRGCYVRIGGKRDKVGGECWGDGGGGGGGGDSVSRGHRH